MEPRPRVLSRSFPVPRAVIDQLGHVNNQAYLRWMQEMAVEHTNALGWPLERYREVGANWVVRSHFIEYLRPAFAGETIHVQTWVATMERRKSARGYRFYRENGEILVRAETVWVLVDADTGRPVPIPETLRSDFPVVDDDEIRRLNA